MIDITKKLIENENEMRRYSDNLVDRIIKDHDRNWKLTYEFTIIYEVDYNSEYDIAINYIEALNNYFDRINIFIGANLWGSLTSSSKKNTITIEIGCREDNDVLIDFINENNILVDISVLENEILKYQQEIKAKQKVIKDMKYSLNSLIDIAGLFRGK